MQLMSIFFITENKDMNIHDNIDKTMTSLSSFHSDYTYGSATCDDDNDDTETRSFLVDSSSKLEKDSSNVSPKETTASDTSISSNKTKKTAKTPPPISRISNSKQSSYSIYSNLTFSWIAPLFEKGNVQDQLHTHDLQDIPLPVSCETNHVYNLFQTYWNEEKKKIMREGYLKKGRRSIFEQMEGQDNYGSIHKNTLESLKRKSSNDDPSLGRALFKAFSPEYIQAGLLKLIHDINIFIGPIVLHGLIEFLRNTSDQSIKQGLVLTALVTFSQIVMSLCLRHYFYKCYTTGLRMRTAIIMAVYEKALLVSTTERQKRTIGEIVNLMTVDAERIQDVTTYGHAIWYSFLQIGLSIYFLWKQLGPSCLGGVMVMLIMIPINRFLASWMGQLQERLMEARDTRVDVNNEILSNMKIIKLQSWESSFKDRILTLRQKEIKQLYYYVIANAFNIMMWSTVPIFVAVATFTAYTLAGHELDIAKALTALALFDILRFPLFMLPQTINDFVEASVSLRRVKNFLLSDDYVPVSEGKISSDVGIQIYNATFFYDSKVPNIEIRRQNNHEKLLYQALHEQTWEIQLLKAQLADAEKQLIALSHNKSMTEDVAMVPLVDTQQDEQNCHVNPNNDNDEIEDCTTTLLSLRRINFECGRGELIAIVGSVASGKSSFINAVLGEVRALSGTIAVKGRIAFCPQLPFIMNDTLKNNIIFGKQTETFDVNRYNLAIRACALEHDLEILNDGDQTEIGEKGITLSGGQKSRVAMARAVYHDADIYLLDDPLAAVDQNVAKHLVQKCIVDELLLNKSGTSAKKDKKSTILLVTNAVQYLSDPNIDKIVVLDNGEVVEVGTYQDLSKDKNSFFSAFLSIALELGTQSELDSTSEIDSETNTLDQYQNLNLWDELISRFSPIKIREELHSKSNKDQASDNDNNTDEISSNIASRLDSLEIDATFSSKESEGKISSTPLMTNELVEREKGHVTLDIYLLWTKAAGGIIVGLLCFISYAVDQSIAVGSKWFLTYWSRHQNDDSNGKPINFLIVYALINLARTITVLGRVVMIYFSGLRASRILFSQLLDSILTAPMTFFDTTPTGRIINRFSKDIFTMDEKLVSSLRSYLAELFNVVGVILVVSFVTPYFILCLIPMVIYYINQQQFFSKTYRELKRLDSVSRSPLYALLGESLDGIVTIRSYRAEFFLISKIISMLDLQQNAYFLTYTAQCWLAVRLELVGTLIISSACLCAVIEYYFYGGSEIFAGLAGLSISFALSVTQSLNWTVRMRSDLEAYMISVERIQQYCKIQSEAAHYLPSDKSLRFTWPSDGKITFSDVKLRYRPNLPLVLKGLEFEIPARCKVGIVGRTGAGKSSLMLSLLRIVELSEGSIMIDGIDISKVGLKLLRSSIAVIPQDPVLFAGTIRTNLDPFSDYTDERLHEVLERVGLKSDVKRSNSSSSFTSFASIGGSTQNAVKMLSDVVLEGGSNFSVGQRQLLVIARSLLRGARIVIMDEATASVDGDTDIRIQRVMRAEFKGSTVITIAHRINTIMDSDYILVMDDGKASEFDKPDVLLKKGGPFKDLVNAWEKEHKLIT